MIKITKDGRLCFLPRRYESFRLLTYGKFVSAQVSTSLQLYVWDQCTSLSNKPFGIKLFYTLLQIIFRCEDCLLSGCQDVLLEKSLRLREIMRDYPADEIAQINLTEYSPGAVEGFLLFLHTGELLFTIGKLSTCV